jgi:hypothetical protein
MADGSFSKGEPMEYLSDAFQARQMPNRKLKRAKEKPDMDDLPLFSRVKREHEEKQQDSQLTIGGKDDGKTSTMSERL